MTRRISTRLASLKPSLYARIQERLAAYDGELYPFHIGDTHLPPHPAIHEALTTPGPAAYRYGHPHGCPALRDVLAGRLCRAGDSVRASDIIITNGATHALHLACHAVLDPGDEVLLLAPYWPLIRGMVEASGATPVEVPFFDRLRRGDDAFAAITAAITPRTKALYVTTPNNPDGTVLSSEERATLAALCEKHDLLVFIDEAYEAFHFSPPPPALRRFGDMAERSVSVFSFSKGHRSPGLRLGYAIAPPDVRDAMIRLANLSVYNVPMVVQSAGLNVVRAADDGVSMSLDAARRGAHVAERVLHAGGLDVRPPEGGAYVFVDLDTTLGPRSMDDLFDRATARGVVFAPGAGFGAAYSRHARLCFTSMPPDKLERGLCAFLDVLQTS